MLEKNDRRLYATDKARMCLWKFSVDQPQRNRNACLAAQEEEPSLF